MLITDLHLNNCRLSPKGKTVFKEEERKKERCNGADKMRGVRIHVQAFINRHGQKHRQGRTTGKQVY